MARRPYDWYNMTPTQQTKWERNEREQRRAVEEAEDEAARARDDARRAERTADTRRRELIAERDDFADEAARMGRELTATRRLLSLAKQWILNAGHDEEFQAWLATVKVETDVDE